MLEQLLADKTFTERYNCELDTLAVLKKFSLEASETNNQAHWTNLRQYLNTDTGRQEESVLGFSTLCFPALTRFI